MTPMPLPVGLVRAGWGDWIGIAFLSLLVLYYLGQGLRRLDAYLFGREWGCPSDRWTGRVVGRRMASDPWRRDLILRTVEWLDIQPDHRVLEIGYGPGLGLEQAARRAHRGWVVGVDRSRRMHRMAAEHNARAVAEGRMSLLQAAIEDQPELGGPFHIVFGVQVTAFWSRVPETLRFLAERLVPGGTMAFVSGAVDAEGQATIRREAEVLARCFEIAGLGAPACEVEETDWGLMIRVSRTPPPSGS